MAQFEDEIPPRLKSEFDRLRRPSMQVPGDLDDAVLGEAKAMIAHRFALRRARRYALIGGSLAAAAVLSVAFWHAEPASTPIVTSSTLRRDGLLLQQDLNHDGKIDILDALYLAKRLKQNDAKSFDVNLDGVVDQRDVDAIAETAVRVGGAS